MEDYSHIARVSKLLRTGKTKGSSTKSDRLKSNTFVLSVHKCNSSIKFTIDDYAVPVRHMHDFCVSKKEGMPTNIITNAVLVITGDNNAAKIDNVLLKNGIEYDNVLVLNIDKQDTLTRVDISFLKSIQAHLLVFDIGVSMTSISSMARLLRIRNTKDMVWDNRVINTERPMQKAANVSGFSRRLALISKARSESIQKVGEILRTMTSIPVSESGKNSYENIVIKRYSEDSLVVVEPPSFENHLNGKTEYLNFIANSAVIAKNSNRQYKIQSDLFIVENKTLHENIEWLRETACPAMVAYDGNTQLCKELLIDRVVALDSKYKIQIFMDYDGAGFKNALRLYSSLLDNGINASYYVMPDFETKLGLYGNRELYLTNDAANNCNQSFIDKINAQHGIEAKEFLDNFMYVYNMVNTRQLALEQESVYIAHEDLIPRKQLRLKP